MPLAAARSKVPSRFVRSIRMVYPDESLELSEEAFKNELSRALAEIPVYSGPDISWPPNFFVAQAVPIHVALHSCIRAEI